MEVWHTLLDVLVLLSTSLVLGIVCERLGQSPILGYLAAGTLLGPNALQVVGDADEVAAFAELGVALLLFTIGLEFSWRRLRRLGPAALGGGTAQVIVTLLLGAGVSLVLGASVQQALALGAIVALSSTACVLRLLVSRAEIESVHGRHALGILLTQDVAVVPLVLLVTLLAEGGSAGSIAVDVLRTLGLGAVLVLALVVLFNVILPRVLVLEQLQRNRDLPILLAIVCGLGSAVGAHELGLSPALGAFVAGVLLAESPFATQIRADIGSVRTLLVTLFFSAVGMLGDPVWLAEHVLSVTALVVALVVGKALIVWGVLRLFGLQSTSALTTGICLAQVGEFSFVLAEVAGADLLDEDLFKLVISATIASLFLTPYLVAYAPRIAHFVVSRLHALGIAAAPGSTDEGEAVRDRGVIVIVGFGPAGQVVGEACVAYPERVVVVDLSLEMLRVARQHGFRADVGDATHADVLEHAGVATASCVLVTVPDPVASRAIVGHIRAIAPQTHVIARARYHRYLADLDAAGASEVVDEERHVGSRLAARLRAHLRRAPV